MMRAGPRIVLYALMFLVWAGISPAMAHDGAYPGRAITVVVPFTPGSATDIVARVVSASMAQDLGQSIVVENRSGAGGTIGAAAVARSAPDGYTLLMHSNGHASNPALYPQLPYDTLRDFRGVTLLANLPNVLITSGRSGYGTVADLLATAKARPTELNYSSAGIGSATHINAEKFNFQAGIDATHIPFKGTPAAVSQVVSNEIDYMFAPIVSALGLIESADLHALAVSSATRSSLLPDVPTTIEAGVPSSDFNFWVGLLVPAGTPSHIVQILHKSAAAALAAPEVKKQLAALGAEPALMDAAQFDAYIESQTAQLKAIIVKAGVALN